MYIYIYIYICVCVIYSNIRVHNNHDKGGNKTKGEEEREGERNGRQRHAIATRPRTVGSINNLWRGPTSLFKWQESACPIRSSQTTPSTQTNKVFTAGPNDLWRHPWVRHATATRQVEITGSTYADCHRPIFGLWVPLPVSVFPPFRY